MKTPLLSIILLCISITLDAQVSVSATQGTANATYSTLKAAFDAVNAGTHQGALTIAITDNTTETASAVLYQSGYNSTSSYTSVSIYPTVTGKSISGSLTAPLIDLNGADNVTIDGRLNATGSTIDLTINNSSTSSNATTSTIRFVSDATYNTVKYTLVKGSSSANPGGLILFHTGTSTGNNNNTITNNSFTASTDANRPHRVICGYSTTVPSSSANVISNNSFYNFFNRAQTSFGINLQQFSSGWTISGNSFYETASFVPAASNPYYVINISGSSSGTTAGHIISGNYIGGSAAQCSGTWTKTGAQSDAFYGIYITAYGSTPTEIQGNVIKGFDYANSSVSANFYGIYIGSGGATTVNIGTTASNIIGAATGNGAIVFKPAEVSSSAFYGIFTTNTTSGIINVSNNTIGSVTVSNSVAANAAGFYGIYNASGWGTTYINGNTIGSSVTSNSINVTAAATSYAQKVYGVASYNSDNTIISGNNIKNLTNGTSNATVGTAGLVQGIVAEGGMYSISNNTIQNLTIANANNSSSTTMSAAGIVLNVTSGSKSQNIIGNNISAITNSYGSFAGSICGIYYAGTAAFSMVDRNMVYDIKTTGASVTAASVFGIKIASGTTQYSNNIVALGDNSSAIFYGIYETGASSTTNSISYNTIYIFGAPVASASNSYALYSNTGANIRDFQNNILFNNRSNNGATGYHYALYFNHGVSGNLILNFNDYHAPGSGGVLGRFNNLDVTSLPIVSSNDGSSIATDPLLASAGGTTAADYLPSAGLIGTPLSLIRYDFNAFVRSATLPKMGAIEGSSTANSSSVYINNVLVGSYTDLKAAFDKINDGTHQGAIQIRLSADQILGNTAKLNPSGSGAASYSSVQIYPTVSDLIISGSLPGTPLIDLDGADNVTIDGRVNASGSTKSLTIANTSSSGIIFTSTIRFINDASANTIKYCILRGAASGNETGILYLSTSTGTTGNDANIFDNNSITGVSRNLRPNYGVFSSGTTGKDNSENQVTNSHLFDLAENANTGFIYLSSNSSAFSILNNHFYETTSFGTASTGNIYLVYIISPTGSGFNIEGNNMGGSAAYCGGSPWTKNNLGNGTFYGIYISSGTAVVNSVQGNTITNFNYANSGAGYWYGMYFLSCAVNIGNISGNTIGAASGTGAITFTAGASGAFFYGIGINNGGTSICSNNVISSITLNNTAATGSVQFYGINKNSSAAAITISNNTVGGSTANSIDDKATSTGAAQFVVGLSGFATGSAVFTGNTVQNLTNRTTNSTTATTGRVIGLYASGTGTYTINNNTIHDLNGMNANMDGLQYPSVGGLILDVTSTTAQTITGNSIYNLYNGYTSFTGSVTGMYIKAGTSNATTVEKNMVKGLIATNGSASCTIYGIKMNTGTVNFSNNIVSVGMNGSSTSEGIVYGALENGAAGSTSNWYHNTIQVNGNPATGAANSYALYSNSNLNTRDFRNNIFSNQRSNSGASGTHFGAYFNYASTGTLTLDYNNYYVSGTGSVLGYYNTANVSALPLISGFDAASINLFPGFADANGPTALHYVPSNAFSGVTIAGITDDHISTLRGVPPTIGAMEFSASLAVRWITVTGKLVNETARIQWQVSNEAAGSIYNIQYSKNAQNWVTVGTVHAKGNAVAEYSFLHQPTGNGKSYYRIMETDALGQMEYSKIIIIDMNTTVTEPVFIGNPVRNGRMLLNAANKTDFTLFTLNGQLLMQRTLNQGVQFVELAGISKGIYIARLGTQTVKLIIE